MEEEKEYSCETQLEVTLIFARESTKSMIPIRISSIRREFFDKIQNFSPLKKMKSVVGFLKLLKNVVNANSSARRLYYQYRTIQGFKISVLLSKTHPIS